MLKRPLERSRRSYNINRFTRLHGAAGPSGWPYRQLVNMCAHAATMLPRCNAQEYSDGKLFLYGGMDEAGKPLHDAWLYDTAKGHWECVFWGHSDLVLPTGSVGTLMQVRWWWWRLGGGAAFHTHTYTQTQVKAGLCRGTSHTRTHRLRSRLASAAAPDPRRPCHACAAGQAGGAQRRGGLAQAGPGGHARLCGRARERGVPREWGRARL